MNRLEKIRLLKGIREGRLSKRVLMRPKTYLFTEKTGDEIYYETECMRFKKTEYDKFCKEVELDNQVLKYLNLDSLSCRIITIVFVKGKTIL